MEYPMQVQGNMVLIKMTVSKFHGIPWNSVMFHLAAPEFLYNSMEFDGTW